MRERRSDPSNQLPWQRSTRGGGRDGGEGRGGGGSLSRRRKQLEGVCGEVGAGMWLQLQTLKHEGKNWDRFFFFFFFHSERRDHAVCVCMCEQKVRWRKT